MTRTERPSPGRFRWRLILSFVLVAALSSGAVALGSFILVRRDRLASLTDRATGTTELTGSFLERELPAGPTTPQEILEKIGSHRSFEVLVANASSVASSDPTVTSTDIDLDEFRLEGDLRTGVIDLDGEDHLIVAPVGQISGSQLVFFFRMTSLQTQMHDLALALFRAWLAVAIMGALVGNLIARRTLRPVARAGVAARALAEGLLDTRLPEDRMDEFGAWALSFNQMAHALQEKIHALTEARDRERRFTADVAHELRTPVTSLVSAASMLRAELQTLGPEARWAAEELLNQVVRIRALVQELLELSRLDARQETLSLESIDLSMYLERLLTNRGWSSRVRRRIEAGAFASDRRRLDRIVSNLVENALQHGGGAAELIARPAGDGLEIIVRDSGAGIRPDDVGHVFERFFKGSGSKQIGSGLGLAIAQENAMLLGGSIEVLSNPDEGSTFTVRLPALASVEWSLAEEKDLKASPLQER